MATERFEKAKNLNGVVLAGVQMQFVQQGETVKELRLTDGDGSLLMIKPGESYSSSLEILLPAKPKMKKVYLVGGTLDGKKYAAVFDEKHEAEEHKTRLQTGVDNTELHVSETETPEDLEVEEDGNNIPF